MLTKIHGANIAAIRAAVPSQKIYIEDELEFYGNSLKKVQRVKGMIGTDCRRLAWPGQTASDLCYAAAEDIFKAYPDKRQNIDAIIFVTQSPDYEMPATACILQDRLNLPHSCAAFDVNQGCAGFVYGLWLGASLVSTGCENVLVLAGDTPENPRDVRNRVIAAIFGDGGSAALICKAAGESALYFSIGTDGSGYKHLIMPAGRNRISFSRKFEENRVIWDDIEGKDGFPWRLNETYMDGSAVFSFTMRVVPDHINDFLRESGISKDSVDYFLFHQANKQIITEIAKKAKLPLEKVYSETFSRYGNLSSASIPAVISDLFGPAGTSGKTRLLLSGYGVGLSWASCIWDAEDCDCAPVLDVPAPENGDSEREELINYWRSKIGGK